MVQCSHQVPRSCDLLDLVEGRPAIDIAADVDDPNSVASVVRRRGFLVWLIDDRDTVVVRSAATLSSAVEVARAYRAAWGGKVRFIEGPDGELVDRAEWEQLVESSAPLPYVYTVELRSPRSNGISEVVSALWTSTDLSEALQWRSLLPDDLRSRALVVSNAPDGHYPNLSRPRSRDADGRHPTA
ncbi:hypothetical protein JOE30_003752 [Rhodococcus sp. PvP016]|nr:hypothetical protein [Rhodococcus sp. PvP016]